MNQEFEITIEVPVRFTVRTFGNYQEQAVEYAMEALREDLRETLSEDSIDASLANFNLEITHVERIKNGKYE